MVLYHVVFKPRYNYGICLERFNLTININTRDMRKKVWMSFIIFSCWLISELGLISNSWKKMKNRVDQENTLQGQREGLVNFTGFQ